jgi:hypothetical protein
VQDQQQVSGSPTGGESRRDPAPLRLNLLSLRELRSYLSGQPKWIWAVAFAGFMLSPFSPYNDAIVNIPPSLFLAWLTAKVVPVHPAILAGIYYVLSNLLGIGLMALAFARLSPRPSLRWSLSRRQLIISAIYVAVSVVLTLVSINAVRSGLMQILGR